MAFIHNNDPFICQKCGEANPPAISTCRDHCRKCLYSIHVDTDPGDRASLCKGFMEPLSIETKGDGSMSRIVYACLRCGKKYPNKIAEDDDKATLFEIYKKNTQKSLQ